MSQHKFKVGDVVTLAKSYIKLPPGPFEVVRLLPSDSAEPAYRIKSKGESYERAVREYEISAAEAA
jgi:hypothetical protein